MAKGIGTAAYLLTGMALATYSTVHALKTDCVDLKKCTTGEITLVDIVLTVTWPLWAGYETVASVHHCVNKKRNNPQTKEPNEEN